MAPPEDLEDLHPGLARERTQLAWTRTAIAFAAVGGVILKTSVVAGVIVLAMSGAIWGMRHLFPDAGVAGSSSSRPWRLLLVTVTVTAVALVALAVSFLGHAHQLR